MTSRPRNYNGTEGKDLWTERYGRQAGEAPMVSRVGLYDGGSTYRTIDKSGNYTTNNILVHSIKIVNQTNDTTVRVRLYDGFDTNTTTYHFDAVVNHRARSNSILHFNFPVPILLTNGGRVYHSSAGCLTSVCYTILNSSSPIPNANSIYLTCAHHGNTDSLEDPAEEDKYVGNDCEILGVYLNYNSEEDYAHLIVKNREQTPDEILSTSMYENTAIASTGHDNNEPEPNIGPWFFPYPVYARGGFRMDHAGNDPHNLQSTVFYRVVNTHDVDYGWV